MIWEKSPWMQCGGWIGWRGENGRSEDQWGRICPGPGRDEKAWIKAPTGEERADWKDIQEVEGVGIGVAGAMLTTRILVWVTLRMLMPLFKTRISRRWAVLEGGPRRTCWFWFYIHWVWGTFGHKYCPSHSPHLPSYTKICVISLQS